MASITSRILLSLIGLLNLRGGQRIPLIAALNALLLSASMAGAAGS